MKNKTILITGGAGYIGSHANKMLYEKGYDTVVFDNLVYGHKKFVQWGEFVLGDLADYDLLDMVFKHYSIDAVMHFAAYAYVGESVTNPEKYYYNNVVNTLNLLKAMRMHDVNQFIFSSSCATYGIPQKIPIPEDHPQMPINPYGQCKLIVENVLRDYADAYNLKYVSLRYFNAAGADPDGKIGEAHDPETHLIPLILDAASDQNKHISIFGTDYNTPDGTCIRDYIHVNDLAQAHILALNYLESGADSDVFNLGNGNGISVKEMIETARQVTCKTIQTIESPRRPGDPDSLVGSASKAKKILGWRPQYTALKNIIETAWHWKLKQLS
ncbi:UDP-glucose 4-epimerase GalE [Desulfococcaceae bacterium HSG7]|nr:UDP-glucose 4-epimerase GalE [Desulfococcaceae bacterium HSG9]MDM8553599.1 UDP-glucose 4-epimerase GalE [Desulfococcaceae bacterium HSG7]